MQELIAHTRHLADEHGKPLIFRYTLLECQTRDGTHEYGLGVDSSRGESIRMPHLSVDRTTVEALLEQCVRLTLSPTHLPDVVEDWLGQ